MRLPRDRLGYLLIGVGTGALVDAFVLHGVLQWHHLFSERTHDMHDEMVADAVFDLVMLAVLVAGVALLAGRRVDGRLLAGFAAIGWGTFHVIDQLVFHMALGAHHIRDATSHQLVYDWAFTGLGLLLAAAGALAVRRAA